MNQPLPAIKRQRLRALRGEVLTPTTEVTRGAVRTPTRAHAAITRNAAINVATSGMPGGLRVLEHRVAAGASRQDSLISAMEVRGRDRVSSILQY